jgi:pyruvate/2-oxoglutarate/acetoin dehydrogenase E1 component
VVKEESPSIGSRIECLVDLTNRAVESINQLYAPLYRINGTEIPALQPMEKPSNLAMVNLITIEDKMREILNHLDNTTAYLRQVL